MNIMDEAFLIDTDVAHVTERQLERFDKLPQPHIFGDRQAVLDWETRRLGQFGVALTSTRHDLAPRAGQVMYALYQLHCFSCDRPTNACAFPGCGAIREQANAVVRAIYCSMDGQCTHGAGDSCQTERAIYSMGREAQVNFCSHFHESAALTLTHTYVRPTLHRCKKP